MSEQKIGKAKITAEYRRSDSSSVASDLFGTYPCRLHLTSRPNNEITTNDITHTDDSADNKSNDTNSRNSIKSKALACYVLGYGGGLISGDTVNLEINVKPQASLVVTSQSTSKAFKAIKDRDATFVKTTAAVGKKGLLFLVPQPMQCFGGSNLLQETHVVLDGFAKNDIDSCSSQGEEDSDPSLLLVDWYTGGRKNMDGGLWNMQSFHTLTTVSYSKQPLFYDDESADNGNDNSISEPDKQHRETVLVFRDATRLSGGHDLLRHMRHFNIICTVVILGPRVKNVADMFLDKFSSRHVYDENQGNNTGESQNRYDKGRGLNQNKGDGLNQSEEGLLVSCGTFLNSQRGYGVVVRLAADSLEIAATFLSKHIGTLDGQLNDDPFMEILSSKQFIIGQQVPPSNDESKDNYSHNDNNSIPIGLLRNSFSKSTSNPNPNKETSFNHWRSKNINPLLLYQLIDSCVPTGGFAHSNTLEAAHQLHLLTNQHSSWTASLLEHSFDALLQSFTSTVPFLIESCELFRIYYHHGEGNDGTGASNATSIQNSNCNTTALHSPSNEILIEFERIDNEVRATMSSHVACRASTTQGSGMLRAFASSFPQISPVIKVLRRKIIKMMASSMSQHQKQQQQHTDTSGHAATCFGAVCGLLNISIETCVSMHLYTTARDMVNAAVRMNLIGPLEGGFVTNQLCVGIETLIERHLGDIGDKVGEDKTRMRHSHQVAPLIEVLSNAHDRLYTRLFNS